MVYLHSGIFLSYKKKHIINRCNKHKSVTFCKTELTYNARKMKTIIIDRQTKKMNFGLKSGFLHVWGDKETATEQEEGTLL